MTKAEQILKKFAKPNTEKFGTCGWSLPTIAKELATLYGRKRIKINLPYHDFNCKGTANRVAKETIGVMPFTKQPIKGEVRTFFYGDKMATRRNFLPFLSECDVYWVEYVMKVDDEVIVNLIKAPSWRTYL